MKLTDKLLGYLNRVFDKGPKPFLALRVGYLGPMTWEVADGFLYLNVPAAPGLSLSYDLSAYTLGGLAAAIGMQTGWTVSYLDSTRAALSAMVLLDARGDPAATDGDHLYGYTSLLWAFMDAFAAALTAASAQIVQMPREMDVNGADGVWLDELGGYYGVIRSVGEADGLYGPRIIAEAIRPRGNNNAIANALTAYTGQAANVVDVQIFGGLAPLHDGSITHNSAHTYNSVAVVQYGLFDVEYAYDLISGGSLAAFHDLVVALVEKLRDAGTHLRALALKASALTDSADPPDDSFAPIVVGGAFTEAFTAPSDSSSDVGVTLYGLADALTAPDDATDDLSISCGYSYNGGRLYDGLMIHAGGLVIDEALDGTIRSIA